MARRDALSIAVPIAWNVPTSPAQEISAGSADALRVVALVVVSVALAALTLVVSRGGGRRDRR